MKLHIFSLQNLMVEVSLYGGFLLTGQTVTVAFWRCKEHLYLFNSHTVNEERRFDFFNENNNLVRLFLYDGYGLQSLPDYAFRACLNTFQYLIFT